MQTALDRIARSSRERRKIAFSALEEDCFLGLRLVSATQEETLDWLCARLEAEIPSRVALMDAQCGNASLRNPVYRSALSTADAILPEGAGIGMVLRACRVSRPARLSGAALVPALCQRLAQAGHGVFLLGGRKGVAEAAAAALHLVAPGLIIAGTRDGAFYAGDELRMIRSINMSGASVVLVALPVPQRDVWLGRNAARLHATLMLGVNDLFNTLAGGAGRPLRRAPGVARLLARTAFR